MVSGAENLPGLKRSTEDADLSLETLRGKSVALLRLRGRLRTGHHSPFKYGGGGLPSEASGEGW